MMQRAGTEPINSGEWARFMASPADYAKPQRLAVCFDGAISEAACERLLRTERLRTRLSTLLLEHYQLSGSAESVGEIDQIIAPATSEDLEEIALRAGAIYWADSFAGIILGHKAAALHEALGEEVCAFAVANRDLAGREQPLDSVQSIRERVLADGRRCLGAWCHAAPTAIGGRVRLKLQSDELIDGVVVPPFAEIGPAIVRRAAG